jgi:hypothetical protein
VRYHVRKGEVGFPVAGRVGDNPVLLHDGDELSAPWFPSVPSQWGDGDDIDTVQETSSFNHSKI